MDRQTADQYWRKATESLAGAQSECASGRFNNCANRAYYAVLQAAITALIRDGIQASGDKWPHTFVQSEFVGKLINRRHRYPSAMRGTLGDLQVLRHRADYRSATIAASDANRALRRCLEFVEAVQSI